MKDYEKAIWLFDYDCKQIQREITRHEELLKMEDIPVWTKGLWEGEIEAFKYALHMLEHSKTMLEDYHAINERMRKYSNENESDL